MNYGGGTGIRTQTAYAYTGFQDRLLAIRTSLRNGQQVYSGEVSPETPQKNTIPSKFYLVLETRYSGEVSPETPLLLVLSI